MDTENRCNICSSACHDSCMCVNSDHGEMCLACAATRNQAEISGQEEITQSKENIQAQKEASLTEIKKVAASECIDKKSGKESGREKKTLHDTLGVKQRELRQLEMKLNKWEEDLRVREAKASDLENDTRRLEDYINRTEARNLEPEKTVQTLHRRINLMAVSGTESGQTPAVNTEYTVRNHPPMASVQNVSQPTQYPITAVPESSIYKSK